MGNTALETSSQKLIKTPARGDKAAHTKESMAESAHDRTGELFYNNIKNTKKGFTSKKLRLSENGTPQPI